MSEINGRLIGKVHNPRHFFFLLDVSGSMCGERIQALSDAMNGLIADLCEAGRQQYFEPILHVLAFGSDVRWLCGTDAVNGVAAEDIVMEDLTAGGTTNTAAAISAVLPAVNEARLGRPFILLFTDGCSNDSAAASAAIAQLTRSRRKSIRMAVGLKGCDPAELQAFATRGDMVFTLRDHRRLPAFMREAMKAVLDRVEQDDDLPILIAPGDSVTPPVRTTIHIDVSGDWE